MRTLEELEKLTKAELIAELLRDDRREEVETEYFPNGELKRQVRRLYDAYGKLLHTRDTAWTYHKDGPVDTVTVTEGGKIKAIKHFTDGRQPVVESR